MYKVLDLFCGAGGFSNGLELSGYYQTLLAIDFNEDALKTFSYNHKNAKCIKADLVDNVAKENIIKLAKKLKINTIIGGPPCQGFSSKGKNLGLNDERNFLFKEFINIVSGVNPELFIIENVKNLITCENNFFINEIVQAFSKLGYMLSYSVLNAKDFGVPQNRERAIIIGSKNMLFDFTKMKELYKSKVSVRDAISDLAYLNSGEGCDKTEYKNESKSKYQQDLRGEFLCNHKATKHLDVAIKKLKMIKAECGKECLPQELIGKQQFKTTWGRLKWDDISPTIDTRFDTPSNGRNSHPFLHRAITPREAARIQSFSDNFIFLGSKTEICKQIGNAVPPLLAKAIGIAIYKQSNTQTISINDAVLINDDCEKAVSYFYKNNISFDAIITDPPYNISKENNFNTMKSSKRQGVDFGEWDKEFDYLSWIKKYAPLVKKDGSMIIFCSYLYISFIIKELEENDFIVKDILRWVKSNPMPRNINRRYVQDCELAIWAVRKNAKWTFNNNSKTYLRAEFNTSIVSGKEKTSHPTQKSLKLMQEIIKIHTNENDIILDPFMGSATTGIACKRLKRKFYGIESSKDYFEICKKRFENEF